MLTYKICAYVGSHSRRLKNNFLLFFYSGETRYRFLNHHKTFSILHKSDKSKNSNA